ncbi:MAG: hypothetical protein ACOY82_02745 [Pseudomonadota bacterium]
MKIEVSFEGLAILLAGQTPVWVLAVAVLVLATAVLILACKVGKRR